MNNKYRLQHYQIKRDPDGTQHYMVCIQKEWIEVSLEVFRVLDGSERSEQYKEEKMKRFNICSFEELPVEVAESIYDSGYTPEEELLLKESQLKLIKAYKRIPDFVEKLNTEDSDLVKALFYKGETLRKYAKRLGVPEQNLQYQKKRVLNRLRRMVMQEVPGICGGDLYA